MQMGSSRFFYPVRQSAATFFLLGIFCLFSLVSNADIGETYTLKGKRADLLKEIERARTDTTWSATDSVSKLARLWELQGRLAKLDAQIFDSYEETISRMAAQKVQKAHNDRIAVYIALATSVAAVFLSFLLLMARSRVMNNGDAGLRDLYRQLTMDFVGKVSAEKVTAQRMLRVNVVVIVGLVMMSISVLAYLLTSL